MLEEDYLMRMILLFVRFLLQSLGQRDRDPRDASRDLERQIGDALNIDPGLLFSLAPDSLVMMLKLGDLDRRLAGFVVRAMALDAIYLDAAGSTQAAELRRAQLAALAASEGLDADPGSLTPEAIAAFAEAALANGEQDGGDPAEGPGC